MDYRDGYSSSWRVVRVNPDTWLDAGEVGGVASAQVELSAAADAPLLVSGTFEVDASLPAEEGWWRIEMLALGRRTPVATLFVQSGDSEFDRGRETVTAYGRSPLYPATERKLLAGEYVPAGADGAAWAASLIQQCTPAPVTVEGGFALSDHYVFDAGTTHLAAAWTLLGAANWCMQVDGSGAVVVRAKPTDPALVLDGAAAGMLAPGVTRSRDLSGVPNRYYAIDGANRAVAINDDPGSALSTVSRGRYVDEVDTSPTRVDGETLEAYAARRLAELSVVTTAYSYSREWADVKLYDLVRGALPSTGLEADMRVVSQSVSCGAGVYVSETAETEEAL